MFTHFSVNEIALIAAILNITFFTANAAHVKAA
jgi:hypothetical protein